MIQVASAVTTISANRIVYADGSVNRGFGSSGAAGGGGPGVAGIWRSVAMPCSCGSARGGVVGGRRRLRLGRRRQVDREPFDAEPDQRVDQRDQRREVVEEGPRGVLQRRHAEDAGHVGAAAVPRDEG